MSELLALHREVERVESRLFRLRAYVWLSGLLRRRDAALDRLFLCCGFAVPTRARCPSCGFPAPL